MKVWLIILVAKSGYKTIICDREYSSNRVFRKCDLKTDAKFRNYNFTCTRTRMTCVPSYGIMNMSLPIRYIFIYPIYIVAAIFLTTRGSHERPQKAPTEFPACFLARFLSIAIGGRRWRAEERFRNSYMHSLHPHIHRRFFARQSTIFDERRFQITFCTEPRPAVYLPRFFIDRLSFHYEEKKRFSRTMFSKIYIL